MDPQNTCTTIELKPFSDERYHRVPTPVGISGKSRELSSVIPDREIGGNSIYFVLNSGKCVRRNFSLNYILSSDACQDSCGAWTIRRRYTWNFQLSSESAFSIDEPQCINIAATSISIGYFLCLGSTFWWNVKMRCQSRWRICAVYIITSYRNSLGSWKQLWQRAWVQMGWVLVVEKTQHCYVLWSQTCAWERYDMRASIVLKLCSVCIIEMESGWIWYCAVYAIGRLLNGLCLSMLLPLIIFMMQDYS